MGPLYRDHFCGKKPWRDISIWRKGLITFLPVFVLLSTLPAVSFAGGGVISEGFSNIDHFDYNASTGFWNIEDRVAEAGRVANGDATKPISFGDGSDGVLDSSIGYTFNTDLKPNGYNFISVNISGGTITVTGQNPLVIRSLTTINIAPTISVSGLGGSDGPAGSTSGGAGGTAVTCMADGGAGGTAAVLNGSAGSDGFANDGTLDPLATGGPATGIEGSVSAPVPALIDEFDTNTKFICGGGGGGGGGNSDGIDYGGGGGGGAAGGVIRIISAGNLTVGSVTATGGNGGARANDNGICSGPGGGGTGGNVWLQTLKTLSGDTPSVNGGNGGAPNGCADTGIPGSAGFYRGDSKQGYRPAWAAGLGNYDTDNVAPNTKYVIQSKAYDLETKNAAFLEAPSIDKQNNDGSISLEYAGSVDGTTFTDFTSDILSLSNRSYRYLKFRATITTAAAAGPSPRILGIKIPYQELDFTLSGGCVCATTSSKTNTDPWNGPLSMLPWLVMLSLAYYGFVLRERRPDKSKFPA